MLNRIWQFALETADVAVAIHYQAPWARDDDEPAPEHAPKHAKDDFWRRAA